MTKVSMAASPETLSVTEIPETPEASRQGLTGFDWDGNDLNILRRMISRKDVDLETALQVFFNGAPGRFNLIAQTDLKPQLRARCNLLDSIHRRIVCGFYLPDTETGLGRARIMLEAWILDQESDRLKGRSGRWLFDREMLDLPSAITPPMVPEPNPLHETLIVGFRQRFGRMIRRDRQIKPVYELDT
ncbi:MAG: hypothetical protein ACNA7O_02655 [Rhodobacterales bacterium]